MLWVVDVQSRRIGRRDSVEGEAELGGGKSVRTLQGGEKREEKSVHDWHSKPSPPLPHRPPLPPASPSPSSPLPHYPLPTSQPPRPHPGSVSTLCSALPQSTGHDTVLSERQRSSSAPSGAVFGRQSGKMKLKEGEGGVTRFEGSGESRGSAVRLDRCEKRLGASSLGE